MHLTFAKRVSECPVCESGAVRRSARKGFVERIWFRLAFVWPYRCDDCDCRFWGFQRTYQPLDASLIPLSAHTMVSPSPTTETVSWGSAITAEESRVYSYRSV
jgi:hypothetical protein